MMTQSTLKEIAASAGSDVEALILTAETNALPQPGKIWGLQDHQVDAVIWLLDNVESQAVVNYAIGHYRN